MKKKMLVATLLLAAAQQAAFAAQSTLYISTSGATTNTVDYLTLPVGTPYFGFTQVLYDAGTVVVSQSTDGTRTEKVFAYSRYETTFASTDSFADSWITATFSDRNADGSYGSVNLSIEIVWTDFNGDLHKGQDFTYHIPLSGQTSPSALLDADASIWYGPDRGATMTYRRYTDWTQEPLASVGVNLTTGYIITAVPEPSTYAMLGMGLGLMGLIRRSRKAKGAAPALA